MNDVEKVNQQLQLQIGLMVATGNLYVIEADRNELWDKYISSFPEGTNPIFKTHPLYECSTCRHFIRNFGNVVCIQANDKITTLWDVDVESPYKEVFKALDNKVKFGKILYPWFPETRQCGTPFNRAEENGIVVRYHHFAFSLPKTMKIYAKDSVPTLISKFRAGIQVATRGLEEITLSAIDTVLELIQQNSLYRADQYKAALQAFRTAKKQYDKLSSKNKELFVLKNVAQKAKWILIKNTSIGELLINIEAKSLEQAVGAYEAMVAPANYKRPKTLVTPSMIKSAKKKINDLGYSDSLAFRFAELTDLSVNNVLYTIRSAKAKMNNDVFDNLLEETEAKSHVKNLNKIAEVTIDKFLKDIVPGSTKIELLHSDGIAPNEMTMLAPVNKDAPNILKWGNNFSWAYTGDVTDSLKEKVKIAGGNTEGVLRFTIHWFNNDDLDAHCMVGTSHIYYGSKDHPRIGASLDVDIIHPSREKRPIVENIIFTKYPNNKSIRFYIHQFAKRSNTKYGYEAEVEFGGKIYKFSSDKAVTVNVPIMTLACTNNVFKITTMNETDLASDENVIQKGTFKEISVITTSPNTWEKHSAGPLHYFFIEKDKKVNWTPRAFFVEYLDPKFNEHRKVFEVLGSKLKVQESPNQLSGYGFIATYPKTLFFRVTGKFKRILKVII